MKFCNQERIKMSTIPREKMLKSSLSNIPSKMVLLKNSNHSSSQKTRLNVLSYGIKIWTDLSSILSQITRLTHRQTDRRTDGQNSHR